MTICLSKEENMKQLWTLGAAQITAGMLAACGGGGDSNGYGSIAVSASTTNVSIVSKALTQSSANDAARDKCDADDCKVVMQFEECGAIAHGLTSAGAWVWGVGEASSAFNAQSAANSACAAKGGTSCTQIPNLEAQCN
jgi:hypothetical protein